MPNLYLELEEKNPLNKYGLLRLNYLKKHKKNERNKKSSRRNCFKRTNLGIK